jgi:hypothetical protein
MGGSVPSYHTGGVVGGSGSLSTSEEFANLMKGEVVVTQLQASNFMNSILPNMLRTPDIEKQSMGMNLGKLMDITVQGNLDKTVIPDLERIAEKVISEINKSLGQRGINRAATQFSI